MNENTLEIFADDETSFLDDDLIRTVVEEDDDSVEEVEGEGEIGNNHRPESENAQDSSASGEDLIINAPLNTKPILRNVICNIQCGDILDCLDIAMRLKNAEFNPKKFPAVTFKLAIPKTTNLIFPSGRIVSVGSKSEENGRLSLRKIVRILQKLGYKKAKFDPEKFKIQNIMAKTNIGFPIRLEGLAYAHTKYCRFEPEIFPGLVYRMAAPHICLLIYVSGRIVFTGAKDRNDVYRAYENIYNVLLAFKQKKRLGQAPAIPPPTSNREDEEVPELPPVPDEDEDDDEEEDDEEDEEDEDDLGDEEEDMMNEYYNEMS